MGDKTDGSCERFAIAFNDFAIMSKIILCFISLNLRPSAATAPTHPAPTRCLAINPF